MHISTTRSKSGQNGKTISIDFKTRTVGQTFKRPFWAASLPCFKSEASVATPMICGGQKHTHAGQIRTTAGNIIPMGLLRQRGDGCFHSIFLAARLRKLVITEHSSYLVGRYLTKKTDTSSRAVGELGSRQHNAPTFK